jgi:hypothetical protein
MSTVAVDTLLDQLPAYKGEYITIKEDQTVPDIVREIISAHKEFASFYDQIALYFLGSTTLKTCENIANFLKEKIRYKEESEEEQSTALPTRILTIRRGDCKHFASMTGGILDALARQGHKIRWWYRFASYELIIPQVYHVFVIAIDDDGTEIWIDPTPGASSQTPVWIQDKKIHVKKSSMALRRYIAGVNNVGSLYGDNFSIDQDYGSNTAVDYSNQPLPPITPDLYDVDTEDDAALSADVVNAINLLLQYNVLDQAGNFNSAQLYNLANQVDEQMYQNLMAAVTILQNNAAKVSGFLSTIWRGVKKVTLAGPRGAWLALVSLNVFGYATKLAQAMSTTEGFQKVRDRWYKLGGDLAKLQGAINSGKKKKRIMGINIVGTPAAVAAWVGVAGAIIAAVMPLVKEILNKQRQQQVPYVDGYDPSLIDIPDNGGGGGIMDMIKENPIAAVGIGLLAYGLLTSKSS